MEKDELKDLIDQSIDAMTELGEAEQKLASARDKMEGISKALYANWLPDEPATQKSISRKHSVVCKTWLRMLLRIMHHRFSLIFQ